MLGRDGDPVTDDWDRLGAAPGLCASCEFAQVNRTRRGTAYLRCTRASWDDRLVKYPRLPVLDCPGYQSS